MAEEGFLDVKCRVDGVFEKLKDCSGELHEVERIMTDARDGSSEEWSDLLSTVREMLGALETGLERVPEEQEDGARSKRMRSRRAGERGICTHTCVHHPEIVNPGLWSKLTEDLVGLVFARLPIPRIIELRKSSEAWAAMSDSARFKDAFVEANPKLFGFLGWDDRVLGWDDDRHFRTRILDAESKEWHGLELDFPKGNGYKGSWYACDGGLVCFVPQWEEDELSDCVFVCNPLTDVWRELPNLWEVFGFREVVLVQLVTNEVSYRVILVYSEKLKSEDAETFGAFVYDSRVGSWSMMSSGLVFGTGDSLLDDRNDPLVFDCATKRLIHLNSCAGLKDVMPLRFSILKDRLFVLHVQHVVINSRPRGDVHVIERFVISEFTWESSRSDLRRLEDYHVVVSRGVVKWDGAKIFTSNNFILSAWDNQSGKGGLHSLLRIYDVSARRWRDLPPSIGDLGIRHRELLDGLFMCELRWDANP